ncbi:hypothetical protein [Shewanella colwelliana]|uniref:hypothetical protein n=1 Tax=Shewanella colwelliana TaxID=23 RepID=UPI0022B0508E|nr:hypothetical protein [Shewanella colwelliana]MCZ4336129.1 hypothetical protein [Shewanella colwelliana]
MYLSNAQRWAKLCEEQANIIENLSNTFPQRQAQHKELGYCWRTIADKVRSGESPKIV